MMNLFYVLFLLPCVFILSNEGAIIKRNYGNTGGSVDMTVVQHAIGEDIVEACLDKLDFLNVFVNDYGLLNRIARVESNFGTNYSSADSSRGIWQIPSWMIPLIQANILDPSISAPLSRISSYYGESFVDFGSFDLSIPFHSAITLRIYLALTFNSTTIPVGVTSQGLWWSSNYTVGGNVTQFVSTVNSYEATKECPSRQLDIWFLLDVSSSVGDNHFQTALNFIRDLSKKFQLSSTTVRMGMSTYSSTTTTISELNQHQTNADFEAAVQSTIYQRGRTFTGAAISDVIVNGFDVARGARTFSEGVPRILILLTDGYSSDSIVDPEELAESSGITTFAVGIGLGIKAEEINLIASYPSSIYAYTLENYDDLAPLLVERFATELCKVPAYVPVTTSTQLSVSFNPSKFFSIRIEAYATSVVSISGVTGSGVVYISTLPLPSSILNLAALPIIAGGETILTATARELNAKTASTAELSVTGFDSTAYDVPVYVSLSPQTTSGMSVLLSISAADTTVTTSSPSVSVDSALSSTIDWWAILLIVLASLSLLVVFSFMGLLVLGISRSSKYPTCEESCVSSCCTCFVQSAGY